MINTVAVIGAGTMGNGIAHVFAQAGFDINLIDVDPGRLESALVTIAKNLDRQIAKGSATEETKTATLQKVKLLTDLNEGVRTADLVVEAATENIELKLKIFKQADESAPATAILATNTSSISITKIASATRHPHRVIGMHFMNPAPVMKTGRDH